MEENKMRIPEGWEKIELSKLIIERPKSKLKVSDATGFGNYPFFTSGEAILLHHKKQIDGENIFLATGGVANVKYYDDEVSYSTDTYVVTSDTANLQYLYYFILDKLYYINSNYFLGSGLKHLQKKDFKSHLLLIPKSLTEQKKIAEILSTVDKAIEQTEQLIAKYQRIKTGLMQDLLTKGIDENGNIRSEETHEFKDSPLGRIPVEWECWSLAEIYELKSGITPLRRIKKYFAYEGFNWVKTLDLNEGHLYNTEEKVTKFALENTSLKLMPINSILIAMYGGWEQIGRTSILKKEAGTNQAVTCLYKPKRKMNADFVQLILQQYRYKWKQFAVSTRKDPNITKSDISNFNIVFPKDIKEQEIIANKILETKKYSHQLSLEFIKLKRIKTALMQDLLSGQKRVTNLLKEEAL